MKYKQKEVNLGQLLHQVLTLVLLQDILKRQNELQGNLELYIVGLLLVRVVV